MEIECDRRRERESEKAVVVVYSTHYHLICLLILRVPIRYLIPVHVQSFFIMFLVALFFFPIPSHHFMVFALNATDLQDIIEENAGASDARLDSSVIYFNRNGINNIERH